jgi:hypothetical protein
LFNDTPLDEPEILLNSCFPVQWSQNINL